MTMEPKIMFVVSILLLIVLGVTAVSATTLTVGSRDFTSVGDSGSVDIILDSVPDGLAGYSFFQYHCF